MQRRTLIKAAGLGLAAAAGGGGVFLAARQAQRDGAPYKSLTRAEGETLEALGDVLLPGAREAGVAHFVDAQLAAAPADCLLVLRYFDWPPPYAAFYKGGLSALNAAAKRNGAKDFASLPQEAAETLVGTLSTGEIEAWAGPPAQLFYLAARSDAVDVVYGTMEGFEKLNIPYMAHIEPTAKW